MKYIVFFLESNYCVYLVFLLKGIVQFFVDLYKYRIIREDCYFEVS